MLKKKQLPHSRGQVRIIGGVWRGRMIRFPSNLPIRPTPDRVRETLFNWLSPYIHDTHVLDLFAGTGALGFEALSRGAKSLTLIDQSIKVIQHLKNIQEQFQHLDVHIIKTKCPNYQLKLDQAFDIVFLDPPFNQGLIKPCSEWVENNKWIKTGGLIYIETELSLTTLPTPAKWHLIRHGLAGQVRYHLLQRLDE